MQRNDSGEYLIRIYSNGVVVDTLETEVQETSTDSEFFQEIKTSTEFFGNWIVDEVSLIDKATMNAVSFRKLPWSRSICAGEYLDITWCCEFKREPGYNTKLKL